MDSEFPNKKILLKYCKNIYNILSSYYQFQDTPDIDNYLLKPEKNLPFEGQVLVHENENEIFMGIQFAHKIISCLNSKQFISPHEICVIAEELSHFKFISDLVEIEKKTNLLTIETLGEIDRFLCIMHWNALNKSALQIDVEWKNIHDICDYVFTGKRFYKENTAIYIEAENLAFKHLKAAFADKWDSTYYNFNEITPQAQKYFKNLRIKFLNTH